MENLIDVVAIKNVRYEVRADSLNFMRRGLPSFEYRGFGWLHRNNFDAWLKALQHLARAGDGATRADSANQDIDQTFGVLPQLNRGGLPVDLWVRRIFKLLRHPR